MFSIGFFAVGLPEIVLVGWFASDATYSAKPFCVGGSKSVQHTQIASTSNPHLDANARVVVPDYVTQEFRSGHCPPGPARRQRAACHPDSSSSASSIVRFRLTSPFTTTPTVCCKDWLAAARSQICTGRVRHPADHDGSKTGR